MYLAQRTTGQLPVGAVRALQTSRGNPGCRNNRLWRLNCFRQVANSSHMQSRQTSGSTVSACIACTQRPPPTRWDTKPTLRRCRNGLGTRPLRLPGYTIAARGDLKTRQLSSYKRQAATDRLYMARQSTVLSMPNHRTKDADRLLPRRAPLHIQGRIWRAGLQRFATAAYQRRTTTTLDALPLPPVLPQSRQLTRSPLCIGRTRPVAIALNPTTAQVLVEIDQIRETVQTCCD